jgi:hypothetical protein
VTAEQARLQQLTAKKPQILVKAMPCTYKEHQNVTVNALHMCLKSYVACSRPQGRTGVGVPSLLHAGI